MATIAGLPQKYTGARITSVRVTGMAKNVTTGVLTPGTSFILSASTIDSLEAVTFSPTLDNEEMSGASASVRAHVPIKADSSVEVREIKSANGGSIVLGTYNNYLYFLVDVITTDGTTPQLEQGVFLVESCENEFAEGKSIDVLRGVSAGYPMYVGDPTTPLYPHA